jgi:hypothetical protein
MSIVFMIVCIHINISHVGSVFTVKTKDFCAQSNPLIYGGRMDIEAVDSKWTNIYAISNTIFMLECKDFYDHEYNAWGLSTSLTLARYLLS